MSLRRLVHNIAASVFADSSFARACRPCNSEAGRSWRRSTFCGATDGLPEENPPWPIWRKGRWLRRPAAKTRTGTQRCGRLSQLQWYIQTVVALATWLRRERVQMPLSWKLARHLAEAVAEVERLSWSAHNPAGLWLSGGRYTVGTLIWFDIDATS